MTKIIGLLLAILAPLAGASELLVACDIGAKASKRVEVVRDEEIADTHIYYLRQGRKIRPFFGGREASRGSSVRIACVGKKRRALVVSGEFSANALQGFALTYNPTIDRIERLDFAEKSPPAWLYLGANKSLIVIPTHGLGETNKKYLVYRHINGAKADREAVGMETLPDNDRFDVINLEQSTPAQN